MKLRSIFNRNFFKNLLTLLLSSLITLFLAEFISRVFTPQDLSGSWSVINEDGLRMNKSSGRSIHRFNNREVIYNFDKFGTRKLPNINQIDSQKILILGDSFSFGYLLNNKDTYVYKLNEHYKDKIFYNASTAGWGALDYTSYFERYCSLIKPDITVVILNADDITRLYKRLLESKLYFVDENMLFLRKKVYIPSTKDKLKKFVNKTPGFNFLIENSNLIQLFRNVYIFGLKALDKKNLYRENLTTSTFGIDDVGMELNDFLRYSYLTFEHLIQISKLCDTQLKVIYTGVQIKNNAGIYPTLEFIDDAVKNDFFKKNGIFFKNLTETKEMIKYRDNFDSVIIKFDMHPNEIGADLIYKALKNSDIF